MRVLTDTAFDVLLGICALCVAAGWSLSSAFGPFVAKAGAPVLILAAPWDGGAASIAERGGGFVIGPDQALFGALATFEDPDPRERLKGLGAWAVRDGQSLAIFCRGREV